MKIKLAILAIVGSTAIASHSQAQGLLGIGGPDEDFESGLPFTTTISADFGWDSNATARSEDEDEAAYTRGGIGVSWATGSRRTHFNLGASFSAIHYFDGLEGVDEDVFYNARVVLNARHHVDRRMTIGNNTYLTYEVEPDHAIGASVSRRTDHYLYGYNSTWLSYAWNRRVSTIVRYTINGVDYEDSGVGFSEDRLTQTASLEGRYLLNRLTTLVGEYRFSYTDYESNFRDYIAHYMLVGADHAFSRDLRGTVRVGAQIRDSDAYGADTNPYAEVALRYRAAKHTYFHWITRIGNEDSELRDHQRRYTYRSSLSASQQFSERLQGNAGLTYVHNDFDRAVFGARDIDEDIFALNVGLTYRLFTYFDLTGGYHYTIVSSDDDLREYDRHRISVGARMSF